jgi:hypothetical protein
MSDTLSIAAIYTLAVVAFFCGAWWGRSTGRREALSDAASIIEDEALRAVLHAEGRSANQIFALAQRVRDLPDPPAPAGVNSEPCARKET